MAAAKDQTPSLAPAEWEVMKILWEQGPLAARDVYAALPEECGWAYKTVKTLLSRLAAKGAIEYDQIGNSYLYRAAVARESMMRREVKSLFQRVMGEAFSPVLAHFIEEADLSDEEIQQLKRQLDDKRTTKTRTKPRRGKQS